MFAQSGTGVPSTLQTSRKVDYNGEEFYSPRPLSRFLMERNLKFMHDSLKKNRLL